MSTQSVTLTEENLVRLADLIAERIMCYGQREWLDTKAASAYLGVSRRALYHYVESGLPVHQEATGGKLWFKRCELDSWKSDGCR